VRYLQRLQASSVLEVAGLVAVTAGVAFIWWPASLIVGGLAGIVLAQGMDR